MIFADFTIARCNAPHEHAEHTYDIITAGGIYTVHCRGRAALTQPIAVPKES